MRALEHKDNTLKHIYFDFETEQETGTHNPIYVVAQTVCDHCEMETFSADAQCVVCGTRCDKCGNVTKEGEFKSAPCDSCGNRQTIFQGENTLKSFGEWLFTRQHRDTTVLAHNGKAFDHIFLFHYLIHNNTKKQIIPSIIYKGSKLMCMTVREYNIRIIDSLSFFPMALAKLPKAFGLTELAKGYFPHYFLTSEHLTYKGKYPDKNLYGYTHMVPTARQPFDIWYDTVKNDVFDMQQQIHTYCVSDVTILREVCVKFRQLMLECTKTANSEGLDPFSFVTIASCCLAIHRTLFLDETWEILYEDERVKAQTEKREPLWEEYVLKEGELTRDGVCCNDKGVVIDKRFAKSTIPLVPYKGYRTDKYSNKAVKYLMWVEEKSKREGKHVKIQHAMQGGEKKNHSTRQQGFLHGRWLLYRSHNRSRDCDRI